MGKVGGSIMEKVEGGSNFFDTRLGGYNGKAPIISLSQLVGI